MPLKITIWLLVFFSLNSRMLLYSQEEIPGWVKNKGITPWISSDDYLTGFGMSSFSRKDNQIEIKQFVEDNAKKNLAEKVRVKVISETKTSKQQTGYDFQQSLESEIISLTNIEFQGLKKDFYKDQKNGIIYCLVYVPRLYLIKNYESKLFEKVKEVDGLFFAADEMKKSGQKSMAIEYYFQCFPLIDEISDIESVLRGLEKKTNTSKKYNKSLVYRTISELINDIHSLNDLAFYVAYAFKEQTKSMELSGVVVPPLTYRTTGMSSSFSRQFREFLEHYLITYNKWKIYPIKKYDPTIENMSNIRYAVKGTYSDLDTNIQFNIYVYEILTGIKKASFEFKFNRNLVQEDINPIQPKDLTLLKENEKKLSNKKYASGEFNFEVYTNKGQEDLVFVEGERMQVFLKSNMPCYLQVVYQLQDSSLVLLIENELLDITQINKVYELPFVFTCSPPFGVETLWIKAGQESFPSIKTFPCNNYNCINEKDFSISNSTNKKTEDLFIVEKKLVITTMPN